MSQPISPDASAAKRRRPTRREALGALGAAAFTAAAPVRAQSRTILNDASRLNPTPVHKHVVIGRDPLDATIARVRAELASAAAERRPVALAAARHSMGGQSLARDGVNLTMDGEVIELDRAGGTFRAAAGARWGTIIRALEAAGRSPAVMQSNNDFGIAATFAVNAHGWPVRYGPFGATVRAFRMLLADGSLIACSRSENAELFGLAMGGYGLFGVIVDVEAEMVENRLLRPSFELMPAERFGERFVAALTPDVPMAYGRLDVRRGSYLAEALLITYRAEPSAAPLPPASSGGFVSSASRLLYRNQLNHEPGRRLRWFAEAQLSPRLTSSIATRNSLLNEPVANLASGNRRRTDILHEYFVPPDAFPAFLAACREEILPTPQELLNVTLRFVDADRDSVLRYAPEPRIAAVMSFSQEITPEGEAGMLAMTERLAERVIAIGGAFYLPYRLHWRPDQLERAYPAVDRFVAAKRRHDPGLLFRNALWDSYLAARS